MFSDQPNWRNRILFPSLVLLGPALAGNVVKDTVRQQSATVKMASTSQKRVDQLSDETSRLLEEYRLVVSQTDSLKAYNDQMARLVESQLAEMESIRAQIGEIQNTSREVMPLMARMVDSLEKIVALDVPFLKGERDKRVRDLKSMMDKADVSVSEKFRRIMEAYQVENEYGRTLEAYQDEIKTGDGPARTVDFLKIGRVALIYATLDGKEARAWDQNARQWVVLDDSYRGAIKQGLKIARKQSAPDLLTLPIAVPEAK